MNFQFVKRGFGFSDDPYGGLGLYFVLLQDGREVWDSSWIELNEFCTLVSQTDIKKEIEIVAEKYRIKIDTSSDDPDEWRIICGSQ